jgi:hypothetical protein
MLTDRPASTPSTPLHIVSILMYASPFFHCHHFSTSVPLKPFNIQSLHCQGPVDCDTGVFVINPSQSLAAQIFSFRVSFTLYDSHSPIYLVTHDWRGGLAECPQQCGFPVQILPILISSLYLKALVQLFDSSLFEGLFDRAPRQLYWKRWRRVWS